MKINCYKLAAMVLAFAASFNARGQIFSKGEQLPDGVVVYSLPRTVVSLKVTAEREYFTAGPYAEYAEKYLGVKAGLQDKQTYNIKSLEVEPFSEIDPAYKIALSLRGSKTAALNFLNFSTQGLVAAGDPYETGVAKWRFPATEAKSDFSGNILVSNLGRRSSVLYKSEKTADGFKKVPVRQSQIVEKSLDEKASETADLIFKLRQKRIDIITGNTDATYSGQAMGAVLSEIDKLEKQYMSLFIGETVKNEQTAYFEVVPDQSRSNQIYIAFRISDKDGLLPADNLSGRPVIMEFSAKDGKISAAGQNVSGESFKGGTIYYRQPEVVSLKISDNRRILLNLRLPVYQFGKMLSFPLNIAVK